MNLYELQDVSKIFQQGRNQVRALSGVSLSIAAGERIAIRGSTGGGKSTLLQLLGLLDEPTTGSIWFEGQNLAGMNEAARAKLRASRIGFIFQSYNLIPTLTAEENVLAGLMPLGWPVEQRRQAVADVLASVGLADRAKHLPAELSGGQQQRVAIARALVKRPSVVLADEPTGNLDEETRDEIVDMMEALCAEHALTMITVTHDSALAKRAGRRLTIKAGKLTEN